jgi:hypothetical protein
MNQAHSEDLIKVTSAIRNLEHIDCLAIAQIFATLASKMKSAGFSDVDLDALDEISGFICGDVQ